MMTFVNGAITQQCVSTAAALLEKFGLISLYVTVATLLQSFTCVTKSLVK